MNGLMDELANGDVHPELFAQLPAKRAVVLLGWIELSAWKFPQAAEMNPGEPARHEELSVLFDHRGDDRQDGGCHERPAGRSSANRTRSASCPGVNGFCSSGIVPQKFPCTDAASSVNPDM